jgi:small-conductance mechanosensitive channel
MSRSASEKLEHKLDFPGMRNARPYFIRAGIEAIIALAALVVAQQYQSEVIKDKKIDAVVVAGKATTSEKAIFFTSVAVVLLVGILAVRTMGNAIRKAMEDAPGDGRGSAAAFIGSLVGYIIVFLATVSVLGFDLQALLLGGAITGVVIGIAAQQTLGNFFAGVVLLAVRPFNSGEDIVLRSSPLGGEYRGRVTDVSLFYVKLMTEMGPVALPNAGVLAAAVGPGARAPKDKPEQQQPDPGPTQGGTPQ